MFLSSSAMKALPLSVALLAWQALNLGAVWAASSEHTTIVLLAFDGIPQYYLKEHTTFLQQLAIDSTTTERLLYQDPPQSLPNLQSIATGLYPDIHGVSGDHILDKSTNECIGYDRKLYTRKANITPIWTLNELTGEGRHSGVAAWPGFEFIAPNGTAPTFQSKATDCKNWDKRVDDAVQWLTHEKTPANLILMHFEHNQTRSTETVPQIMKQIDSIVKYYFDQLHHHEIHDKVNTIIVSDHTKINGSVGVMSECGRKIPINDTSSCYAENWENLEAATKWLNAFKLVQYAKLKCNYHRDEISSEAEQYLNAQQLRLFEHPEKFLEALGEDEQNPEMFPLFIANGPLFEPKYKAAPFDNIDIYALISEKLKLTKPAIPINGTHDFIQHILAKEKPVYEGGTFKVILYIIVALLLLACGWYILRIRKQERLRF